MKRTLYTLSAAAALFGAAPATTLADQAEARGSSASCRCAEPASAAAARPGVPASSSDREQEFLRAVWSAP